MSDKLRRKWYAKLKAEGFEDIEKDNGDLKDWALRLRDDRRNGNETAIVREAKEAYYQLANQFLNEYSFENSRDKIIWEYHANGISIRNIVKLLKKVRIKTYRRAVWVKVDGLRKIMKQRYLIK